MLNPMIPTFCDLTTRLCDFEFRAMKKVCTLMMLYKLRDAAVKP